MKWSELTAPQRNALVAEKVMGLRVQSIKALASLPPVVLVVDENEIIIIQGEPEHYSTDMNAAWKIVERMKAHDRKERFHIYLIRMSLVDEYGIEIPSRIPAYWLEYLTPDIICRAALETCEVYLDIEP